MSLNKKKLPHRVQTTKVHSLKDQQTDEDVSVSTWERIETFFWTMSFFSLLSVTTGGQSF